MDEVPEDASDTPEEETDIPDDSGTELTEAESDEVPEDASDTLTDETDIPDDSGTELTEAESDEVPEDASDTLTDETDIPDDSGTELTVDESDGITGELQPDNNTESIKEIKEANDLAGTVEKLDGYKFHMDSNGVIYRVDGELMPNTSYDLNGYNFKTDDLGRISMVEGDLTLRDRDRLTIKDKMSDIGKGDEQETDDRGHIVADLFNGPNGLENMFPQNYAVNRGDYKKLESMLADHVKNNDYVRANYELNYTSDSHRPDGITVTYIINDEIYEQKFPN